MTKPFSPRELVARVDTLLRRPRRASGARHRGVPVVAIGSLTIDPPSREVHVDGEPVPLTRTEFDVLAALARRPNDRAEPGGRSSTRSGVPGGSATSTSSTCTCCTCARSSATRADATAVRPHGPRRRLPDRHGHMSRGSPRRAARWSLATRLQVGSVLVLAVGALTAATVVAARRARRCSTSTWCTPTCGDHDEAVLHAEEAFRYASAVALAVALAAAALASLAVSLVLHAPDRPVARRRCPTRRPASAAGRYDARVAAPEMGPEFDEVAGSFNHMADRLPRTATGCASACSPTSRTRSAPRSPRSPPTSRRSRTASTRSTPTTIEVLREQALRLTRISEDLAAVTRAESGDLELELRATRARRPGRLRRRRGPRAGRRAARSTSTGDVEPDLPDGGGRPAAHRAGPGQPREQRDPPHARRADGHGRARGARRPAGSRLHVDRHRRGHRRRAPPARLRALLPRRHRARPRPRRLRASGWRSRLALAHAHGGTITATSPGPGRGSTFTVLLPADASATHRGPRPATTPEALPLS